MKYHKVIVIMALIFGVAGCANMQKSWEKAQSIDTITAYEYFLRKHPDGELSDIARARIGVKRVSALKGIIKILEWEKEAPEDVKIEIEILRGSGPIQRGYAAIRLGNKGTRAKGAQAALIDVVKTDHTPLKWVPSGKRTSPARLALDALEKIEPGWRGILLGVEPPIEISKDNNNDHMVASIELSDPEDPHGAIEISKDNDNNDRLVASIALGIEILPLIEVLKSDNRVQSIFAAFELAKIGKPSVAVLIEAANDNVSHVSRSGLLGLGAINDPRAVDPLIEALGDENSAIRRRAAGALGNIKDPRAVDPLIEALTDNDKAVSDEASAALEKITGKRFGKDLKKWRDWWGNN